MIAALTCSRRNMFENVRVTEVVPAPEEPVMAMIGCSSDIVVLLQSRCCTEQAAHGEQRLFAVARVAFEVITLDALDFRARAEYETDLLVQRVGSHVEHAFVARARASAGLLDQKRNRIAFVCQAQPSVHAGLLGVARIQEDAA